MPPPPLSPTERSASFSASATCVLLVNSNRGVGLFMTGDRFLSVLFRQSNRTSPGCRILNPNTGQVTVTASAQRALSSRHLPPHMPSCLTLSSVPIAADTVSAPHLPSLWQRQRSHSSRAPSPNSHIASYIYIPASIDFEIRSSASALYTSYMRLPEYLPPCAII